LAVLRVIEHFARNRIPPRRTTSRAFGFFAHATGLKIIERAWWLAFWDAFLELEPEVIPVEFLPPLASAPSDARFPSIHFGSPRALTAAIAATRMFISADTGPMHLASSTAVPTVALFCASDPVLYGPLKPVDLVINIAESTPHLVAQRCQRVWRESIDSEADQPSEA
jgi:heptosyltransferase III